MSIHAGIRRRRGILAECDNDDGVGEPIDNSDYNLVTDDGTRLLAIPDYEISDLRGTWAGGAVVWDDEGHLFHNGKMYPIMIGFNHGEFGMGSHDDDGQFGKKYGADVSMSADYGFDKRSYTCARWNKKDQMWFENGTTYFRHGIHFQNHRVCLIFCFEFAHWQLQNWLQMVADGTVKT